jgi:hypothetical protein
MKERGRSHRVSLVQWQGCKDSMDPCKKLARIRTISVMVDADSSAARLDMLGEASRGSDRQAQYYARAVNAHGPALIRLARGYEADPEHRNDLLQEIHVALWRSFAVFDERCSLLTWIYRVAHHTAAKHIIVVDCSTIVLASYGDMAWAPSLR